MTEPTDLESRCDLATKITSGHPATRCSPAVARIATGGGDRGTAGLFDGARSGAGPLGGLRAVLSGRLVAEVESGQPRTAPGVGRKPMAD